MQGTANRRLASKKRQSNRFILRVVLVPVDKNVDINELEQQRTDGYALVGVGGLTASFSTSLGGEALGNAGGDPAASGATLVFI